MSAERDGLLVDVFSDRHSRNHPDGLHHIALEAYAWRWYRVGAADNTLDLSDLARVTTERPTARDPGR